MRAVLDTTFSTHFRNIFFRERVLLLRVSAGLLHSSGVC